MLTAYSKANKAYVCSKCYDDLEKLENLARPAESAIDIFIGSGDTKQKKPLSKKNPFL